jgi:predicted outer membrane repeat protein
VVSDCLFVNNAAAKLAGDTFAAPPTGGAVMLEDQTHGQFYNCRFVTNSATQGGALSSYRSRNEVQNCVFRNNRAVGTTGAEGLGGAVMVLSDDNPDGSTAGGTINRPSAALTVTDTLLEGPGSDIPIARQGGGIFAGGDLHSTYGVGVQQNGSPATNRTTVNLKRVVFANLATAVGTPGTGGALTGDFVSLTADSCIIENCRTDQFGGGFEFGRQSDVAITNTTFSSNTAGLLGGAVAMLGGNLTISRSNLVENAISGAGGGAAIWTAPAPANGPIPPLDMTGGIQNCIISNNSGAISIYDGDRRSAPFNRMHYNGNQIFFAIGTILFNDVAGNKTVETLNAFTSNSVARSIIPNTVPATAPVAGAVLMVPPSIFGSGAPGETVPTAASVAYAETGAAATVDGVAQSASAGLVTTGSAAQHTLHVATTALATTPLPAAAVNISTRLSVGKGDDALIGGFIVFGSSPKRVLIRAVGPSLPIPGALQDPTLELHSASGATIAANDDWRSTVVGGLISQNQSVDIIASAVAPTSDLESGIVVTLDPGSYTAVLRGKNNTTGVGLLEIYDLDPVQNATLANISTRGFVESADNVMIAGFIYAGGPAATRVAVRGLGPSLTASGVPNALEDPVLELRNSNGTLVEMNDDWSASPQNAAIGAAQLQPTSAAESTIYRADLVPGAYTAVLRGKSNGTGVGLIEVYVF